MACSSSSGACCKLSDTTSAIGPNVVAFAVLDATRPVFSRVTMSVSDQLCTPASCGLVSDGAYQLSTRPPEGPAFFLVAPQRIARFVAGTAVSETLHEIRPTVPFGAVPGLRFVHSGTKEQRAPGNEQQPVVVGECQFVSVIRLCHRRYGAQVGEHRIRVAGD